MAAYKPHVYQTLKELDIDELRTFKFFLRCRSILEGLDPIPRSSLQSTDLHVIGGMINTYYGDNADQIMVNVLQKMNKKDLLERFLEIPNIYQNPITDTSEERILNTLRGMTIKMFVEFNNICRGTIGLPWSQLDKAIRIDTAEVIIDKYTAEEAEQFMKRLCQQIHWPLHGCLDELEDIQGKARLADFGISRRIDEGQTTRHTGVVGTPCWMAKETLNKSGVKNHHGYKTSTDIQVAGMLTYYILSGGHHPFLKDTKNGETWECQQNISECNYYLKHVELDDDMVAKDLVEWMIKGEPKERPEVKKCLAHPFFWPNTWRTEYLRKIGNEKEVEKYLKAEEDENKAKNEEEKKLIRSLRVLIPALDQYAKQGQFNAWKQKFREVDEETRQLFEAMDEHNMKKGPDGKKKKFYSDNSFGLLRFIRNLHAHYAEAAARINLMEMFPALFGYVYKFAKEQKPDWNSRPALRDMFDFCPRCAFTS